MSGKRMYSCDYHYFDKIDTPDKAYWLGFLMADGCVMHQRRLRHLKTMDSWQDRYITKLSVSQADEEHLAKFLQCISSTHPIRVYKTSLSATPYCRVMIEDQHLFGALVSHGVIPNKSLCVCYPSIDEQFDAAFIRGYFDGNGCISHSTFWECNITSTYEMLHKIYQKCPFNDAKEFRPVQRFPDRHVNNWMFRFAGTQQCIRVLSWLYCDSTPETRLNRKFHKYLDLIAYQG